MHSSLIIGGHSTIGSALAARLSGDGALVEVTSRGSLDLAKPPESWPQLPKTDVAYLCAAITGLQTCESDPEATARVNVTHMQALAERLLAQGSHVVFLSSNQVFDGTKPHRKATDAPCPVNAYGRQKARMEPKASCALRLTKVISGLPILDTWTKALEANKPVEAFSDLAFAPIPLAAVVEALVHIGTHRLRGILQLSGARDVTYYEAATALAKKLGTGKVVAASARDSGINPLFLPKHTSLETSAELAHLVPADPLQAIL